VNKIKVNWTEAIPKGQMQIFKRPYLTGLAHTLEIMSVSRYIHTSWKKQLEMLGLASDAKQFLFSQAEKTTLLAVRIDIYVIPCKCCHYQKLRRI
jgi:hypothetical protein